MHSARLLYSPDFRRQKVDLDESWRDPVDLARKLKSSAESIRAWVALAARKEGRQEEASKVEEFG